MKGLAFSVICSPVATKLDINEFQHLEGLEFADEIDAESGMIEILVGADYCTVSREIIKRHTDLTAVASTFGRLLTGPAKFNQSINQSRGFIIKSSRSKANCEVIYA